MLIVIMILASVVITDEDMCQLMIILQIGVLFFLTLIGQMALQISS